LAIDPFLSLRAARIYRAPAVALEHDSRGPSYIIRDAVLECVRTSGVRRDVAADLRLLGRTGVGWVVQPAFARELRHLGGGAAGLDFHPPEQRVERP